jgi:hypothetical protein
MKHLTEEILQQLALNEEHADPAINAHLKECGHCRTAVENYRTIFASVNAMEKPVFEFDAVGLVLPQLPEKKRFSFKTAAFIAVISALVLAPFILMNKTIIYLFENISLIMLGIILVATIGIVIFLFKELINSYKDKMQQLNFY